MLRKLRSASSNLILRKYYYSSFTKNLFTQSVFRIISIYFRKTCQEYSYHTVYIHTANYIKFISNAYCLSVHQSRNKLMPMEPNFIIMFLLKDFFIYFIFFIISFFILNLNGIHFTIGQPQLNLNFVSQGCVEVFQRS